MMDYIMKNCPRCNRELAVPDDLRECICMYCGEHFSIEEKISIELSTEERQRLAKAYQNSFERMGELVEDYDKRLASFTRNGYEACFQEYVKLGEEILLPIEQYVTLMQDMEEPIEAEISDKLLSVIEKNISENKGFLQKNSKSMLIDQHRYYLAVYLIPMLGYLKLELSDKLADCIMEAWRKAYPKSEFKKATYEELAAGFLRKGFCFITSAVCDALDKSDACYELTSFREFRDTYLMNSKAGRRLVEEYYEAAPRIVVYYSMQMDSQERYQKLWDQYLQPCLKDIEHGRKIRCRNRYVRMVRKLQQRLPI